MPHFFACADALIVSLKKDNIFSLTIPAKVQCYLASGKPILGSLDGEGKRVINESKAGFVSPAGDANLFAKNVVRFYNLNSTEKNEMKQNGINYFRSEFGRDKLTDRLIDLLNK
jgi:glycosyltransferase involved in cell wall biosynthesis